MAGLGRRSHYRKHLTDSVLNDLPLPTNSNQRIAKVVGTRGSNQFELVIAPHMTATCTSNDINNDDSQIQEEQKQHDNNDDDNDDDKEEPFLDMTPQLSILPTKYRKLIWLKRNDYVICECAEDDTPTTKDTTTTIDKDNNNSSNNNNNNNNNNTIEGGIRYMITHILYKDQIKNIKENNLWPKHSFFLNKGESRIDNEKREENDLEIIEKAKALMNTASTTTVTTTSTSTKSHHEDNKHNEDGCSANVNENDNEQQPQQELEEEEHEDYEYNDYDDDNGIIFSNNNDPYVNMNRIANLKIDDSSSDEDSD